MLTTPAAPRPQGSRRVLVVDDDELYAESIGCFLGYEDRITVVGYASDGHEAIALSRSLRPDVVVLDLSMPRMNGLEAMRHIRTAVPGTAIVVLSSASAEGDVRRTLEAGACAHVPKSAAADALIPAILSAKRDARSLRRSFGDARPYGLGRARSVERGVDLAPRFRRDAGDPLELLG